MSSRVERYAKVYAQDDGFEAVLVHFRQRLVLERLRAHRPRRIVEVGCGSDLLARRAMTEGLPFDRWIIVEPAQSFGAVADALAAEEPRVERLTGYFGEPVVDAVRALVGQAPDAILLSGVLHEVEDPQSLLRAARSLLAPQGFLHTNVPNAASLHRRVAVAMGLASSLTSLSLRNVALEQFRVYDADSLRQDIEAAGLRVEQAGGYLVKPFTHSQMHAIRSVIDDRILEGLYELGKTEPSLACEVFADARI